MSMNLFGFQIVVAPERPRYMLPHEVLPGVPWPPGFRAEINDWAAKHCGTECAVPEGQMLVMGGTVTMRRESYLKLRAEVENNVVLFKR